MKILRLFIVLALPVVFFACKKWKDSPGVHDPRLDDRYYCNDPEAVNYNWDFPGIPDNTTCFFPSDIFNGTFLFTDSVYKADMSFDSARSLTTYTLRFVPITRNRFAILGFCGPTDSLKFMAERTTFHASADSTIDAGQYFCRIQDTLTGFVTTSLSDTTRMYINFTVLSDTGVNFHMGTAIKQ